MYATHMNRIFKRTFLWPGAISHDRERCQFLFCSMKNPLLYQAARPECGREVRERSLMGPQIVWNRSTRRAGARGGARVGRPRWAEDFDNHRRIFDGGPSTRLRTGDALQAAAAVRAVFDVDVEDPFEQPGPTQARRRALRVIACGAVACSGGLGTISRRSFAFGASTPWKRIRCKRGRGTRRPGAA